MRLRESGRAHAAGAVATALRHLPRRKDCRRDTFSSLVVSRVPDGQTRGRPWSRVQYTYRNLSSNIATYSLLDVAAFGSSGETLPGLGASTSAGRTWLIPERLRPWPRHRSKAVPTRWPTCSLERVRLRIQVDEGGKRGVLTAEGPVSHPPQTARLLEFATSPVQAAESVGPLPLPQVQIGRPLATARWTVVDGGARVVLETSIGAPGGGARDQVVEAAGSRTFIVARTGLQSITLHVDNFIRKTLWLGLVPWSQPALPLEFAVMRTGVLSAIVATAVVAGGCGGWFFPQHRHRHGPRRYLERGVARLNPRISSRLGSL